MYFRIKKIFFQYVLCLIFVIIVCFWKDSKAENDFNRITAINDLPQNTFYTVVQGTQAHIWTGTGNRQINYYGVKNDDNKSLFSQIVPYYWKTNWVRGLIFFIIIGVIYGIHKYKIKCFDIQASILQKGIEEKAIDLVKVNSILQKEIEEKKLIEQELKEQTKVLKKTKEMEEQNTSRLFQLIEELDIAKRKAEAATKAKSEFLANMSHEIRTPINGVIGMTELALGSHPSEEQKEYLQGIKASADLLMIIINDVLDFSKIEAGKLEMESLPFHLRDVVGETVQTFSLRAAKKGLELIFHVFPEVPEKIIGDPHRLRQIILNLINNAIKFTKEGEIIVRIETEVNTEDYTILHFSIQDTGIGISKEKQKYIFEVFNQADGSTTRKYGGSGLGLTISSELVKLMGGEIWVESPVKNNISGKGGPGSIFHFTVKFKKQNSEKTEISENTEILRNQDVLIIEDNQTNRIVLNEIVSALGMFPTLCENSISGLNTLKKDYKKGKEYSVILCDFNITEMDSLEFIKTIRKDKRFTDLPVILFSSADTLGDIKNRNDLKITSTLIKPIKKSDVIQAMVYELDGTHKKDKERNQSECKSFSINLPAELYILLAEDNPINRKLVYKIFTKKGWEVKQVVNGEQAFQEVKKNSYDLIFMDIQMPKMDGFKATSLIREYEKKKGNRTPIIAMTAHAMQGDREKCISADMDEYVSKPIKPENVYQVISRLMKNSECYQKENLQSENKNEINNQIINLSDLISKMDGDKELVKKIVDCFLEEYPKQLTEFEKIIKAGDGENLKWKTHNFKGALLNLGAYNALALVDELEKKFSTLHQKNALDIVKKLEKELHLMEEFINSELQEMI